MRVWRRAWWRAGAARTQYGHGAGGGAHAFSGPGADDVENRVLADEVRAVVDRADAEGAGGLRLREGEGVFLDPGGFVEPCLGLAAAAEEDGQEGEDEGAQDVVQRHAGCGVQAQFSRRALGAGTGGALRPAVGINIHLVSLHR